MVCPFFADILALCGGEQCSPVRVLKSTKVMGSNGQWRATSGRPYKHCSYVFMLCSGEFR